MVLGFELVYMDDFIDELLHEERCCDVILPRIQVSHWHHIILFSPGRWLINVPVVDDVAGIFTGHC